MYQLTPNEQTILQQAQQVLTSVMERTSIYRHEFYAQDINVVGSYLQHKIGCEEREHFVVLFLNQYHRLISAETLFSGTTNQTDIYPREIIKRALQLNSVAIIIGHNHPTGNLDASFADRQMTTRIKETCEMMEIRLLDHFIVSPNSYLSFAEQNYL
ncbi:JAB domain-containing protein [Aggregatibacter actinomycetemcomitans]|uniref:JAB domain-containing protein n=1 Tax=Aggregatibacter actinomycetemcomitans TaxID=714 RepID=UPI001E3BA215|nr:DNA repair protein RadC [Aggregatibacter actinomycetemcomitans]